MSNYPPKPIFPRGCDGARVIQVIETRTLKGAGIEGDPIRWILQYWNFKGELLASHDTMEQDEQSENV